MKIVIDAMGGDYAPEEVVMGAAEAASSVAATLVLVGDEQRIRAALAERDLQLAQRKRRLRDRRRRKKKGEEHKPVLSADLVEIVHTDDFIGMDESPGPGLRKRDNASMVVAARMVRDGEAQAMVCAGNTGALLQVALFEIGRVQGIRRPALAAVLPTDGRPSLALDMGANADCKPEYLLQFAEMGSIYAARVMGIDNPRVGLLNIGTEPTKGSAAVVAAHQLLAESKLNFVGNIEPMGFFAGETDVAVCDGFVGNMVLKTSEAVSEWLMGRVRNAARRTPAAKIGGHLLRPSLRLLKQDISHSDHGGAVLLGLRGVVVKCHGRADAQAITNGIRVAARAIEKQVVELIAKSPNDKSEVQV